MPSAGCFPARSTHLSLLYRPLFCLRRILLCCLRYSVGRVIYSPPTNDLFKVLIFRRAPSAVWNEISIHFLKICFRVKYTF